MLLSWTCCCVEGGCRQHWHSLRISFLVSSSYSVVSCLGCNLALVCYQLPSLMSSSCHMYRFSNQHNNVQGCLCTDHRSVVGNVKSECRKYCLFGIKTKITIDKDTFVMCPLPLNRGCIIIVIRHSRLFTVQF